MVLPVDVKSQPGEEAYSNIALSEDEEPSFIDNTQKAQANIVMLSNDHVFRERKKRSIGAVLTGIRAIRRLLSGTRYKKEESTEAISVFEKEGNYADAILDFFSVSPQNVKKLKSSSGTLIRTGDVGNRKLFLQAGKEIPIPTLSVLHRKSKGASHINTIKYIKD